MIKEIVENWELNKDAIRQELSLKHPENYASLVKTVIKHVKQADRYTTLDPDKIHEIDDGHYQGTLLYIIPEDCYQPNRYWAVKVYYGSCSGCDTLEAIHSYDDDPPTENQIDQYMTLALHIVQGIKEIGGETA